MTYLFVVITEFTLSLVQELSQSIQSKLAHQESLIIWWLQEAVDLRVIVDQEDPELEVLENLNTLVPHQLGLQAL
jgi:hypothetical protein|tara:strand:- start:293 stop:517 length:225 start_codon:yes stop_codon:yes gene_type:complete